MMARGDAINSGARLGAAKAAARMFCGCLQQLFQNMALRQHAEAGSAPVANPAARSFVVPLRTMVSAEPPARCFRLAQF
jgi:hypothetical protein